MLSCGMDIRKYEQYLREVWAKLSVGAYIRVKENTSKGPHVFMGYIEAKYPTYIVIKGGKYRECFHKDSFYCKEMLIVEYTPKIKINTSNSFQNVESNIKKICQNEIDPFKSILEGVGG